MAVEAAQALVVVMGVQGSQEAPVAVVEVGREAPVVVPHRLRARAAGPVVRQMPEPSARTLAEV